jgi:PadR family transcriptional regulator, regulatory protein PadR
MEAYYVDNLGMDTKRSDLLQGTLDLLVLKIVALGPIHGYAIAQRINQISRDVLQVQQGSLYPALHRLEKRGLLSAEWREVGGREAKFYSLTRAGRKQLGAEQENWERLAGAVAMILRTSE